MNKTLVVENLCVHYRSIYGDYKSVDGASLEVFENEALGIAGESGCGKSTLVDGILRLVKPPGYIPKGSVKFKDIDLLNVTEDELQKIRWTKLAYVPQGVMNSLNPVLNIEEQMVDAILDHSDRSKDEARGMTLEILKEVGLSPQVAKMHPHELSGGMKQRVIIATAIALKPSLIIADEPTTALDVLVQKGILQLLRSLKDKYGVTLITVSHDMSAHAQVNDRLAIMYAGQIIETGPIRDVFHNPLHPYSRGLIAAIPFLKKKHIKAIPGIPPSPLEWPSGCRFHPRCEYVMDVCSRVDPVMQETEPRRCVACHLFGERG